MSSVKSIDQTTIKNWNDGGVGGKGVSDQVRSNRFQSSIDSARFKSVTGSGQPLSPIARNYASQVAKNIENDKLNAGRRSYENLGAPVQASISKAVKEAEESGLLTGQEAREMGWMIAKVLGDAKC